MKKVTLTIKSGSATLKPKEVIYEAETMVKAVGLALKGAYDEWNDQYPNPKIFINDTLVNEKMGKGNVAFITQRKTLNYQLNFEVMRTTCMELFIITEQDGVDFIRAVDKNGHFKSQKKFEQDEVAAVMIQAQSKAKFIKSCKVLDAKASLWSKQDFENKAKYAKLKEKLSLMAPATPKKLKQK
jgi:hypothetical protein